MSPLLLIAAGMGGVYFLAKHGRATSPTSSVAANPISTPTAATPQVPDSTSQRQGAMTQNYYPSGFTSQQSPVTAAAPNKTGGGTAPGLQTGGASRGGSLYEKSVYTETATPYTPVGAFTRRALMRNPSSPAKVTTVMGAKNSPMPTQTAPRAPSRATSVRTATAARNTRSPQGMRPMVGARLK